MEGSNDYMVLLKTSESTTAGTLVNDGNSWHALNPNGQLFLRHHEEIALVDKSCKVFIYHDCPENDQGIYPKKLRDKYIISKLLGKGEYGEFRLAFRRDGFERCAVKTVDRSQRNLDKQIELQHSVEHPCIVQLYDVVVRVVSASDLHAKAQGSIPAAGKRYLLSKGC